MLPAPKFPTLPTDLDKQDSKKQQLIMGAAWIEAANAFSTVRQRNENLVEYINAETCHGE